MSSKLGGTRPVPELTVLQQYAFEAFDVMPHIKPSPPEREAIGGGEPKYGVDEDDDDDEVVDLLFLSQHMISCSPLASMAQKNPLLPNAAAIGPIKPYPNAVNGVNGRRRRKRKKMGEPK